MFIINSDKKFLSSRRQRVNVNGSNSDWSNVISGVHQGSVLDPLLFIIYVNDLPEAVQSNIAIFKPGASWPAAGARLVS